MPPKNTWFWGTITRAMEADGTTVYAVRFDDGDVLNVACFPDVHAEAEILAQDGTGVIKEQSRRSKKPVDGQLLEDPEVIAPKIREEFSKALPNKQIQARAYLECVNDDNGGERKPGAYDAHHWNIMHGNESRVVIFEDEHGKKETLFCYNFGQDEKEHWQQV